VKRVKKLKSLQNDIMHIDSALTVHSPSQQQLYATYTEQFSRALKTHLFTLDWSCGSSRCLWLLISIDELWRRIHHHHMEKTDAGL